MPGLVRLNDFGFIPVLLTTRLHLISISALASSHSVSRWKSWRIPGCQAGLGRMPPHMSHCYHGYADAPCSYHKSVPILRRSDAQRVPIYSEITLRFL